MNRHSPSPEPPTRTTPYEAVNRDSQRKKGDRVNYRPAKNADYLRWLQENYALEAPSRLHDRDTADDGTPDHTGEAKAFLGFTQKVEPNDWGKVAQRKDEDGFYLTPMRAAIERLPAERRQFVRDLATNLFTPLAVTAIHGIPDWCAGDVISRTMALLWDCYTDRPIPRRSSNPNYLDKSESQRAAEDAA